MRTDGKKINGWSLGEGAGEVSVTTPEVLWMPISLSAAQYLDTTPPEP